MGFQETLTYLYGLDRFGMKLGLDNIRALLSRLGNPEDGLRFVHVAGTNGKGSVCAFLDSILRNSGYRVGLYTSPHLVRFNERIRVSGSEIPDADVVRLTEEIRPHAEVLAEKNKARHPTFFEFTTAMALRYFLEQKVDAVVLEVGLGGRLDATNIVLPEVAIITRLGYEHTEHLGRTIVRIAKEKAGIIKEGTATWTIEQPGLEAIDERCRELRAPLRLVGRDLTVSRQPLGTDGQRLLFTGSRSLLGLPDQPTGHLSSRERCPCLRSRPGTQVAGLEDKRDRREEGFLEGEMAREAAALRPIPRGCP